MHRATLPVLLLVLLAAEGRSAVPTYSTIELQARSNFGDGFNLPPGSSFNSGSPALNDLGSLTFRLIVVGTTGNAGLWYGGSGTGSVVYDAPAGPLLSDPSINSAGRAAFQQADIGLSDGVLVYDPGTGLTQQAVPPGGIYGIDSFSNPTLNDSEVIGFRADQGAQNAYIFDDAGTQTPVAFEGGGGVGFLFVPEFDEANRFHGKVRLGGTAGSLPDQIRRYAPNGSFEVMAEDDDSNPLSPFTGFSNGVGCSPSGAFVVFTAQRVGGGEGVYRADGSTVTKIAATDDPDVSAIDFFAPQVNDAGVAAFRAYDASGLRVIYAGDGTTLRRVVGEHDVVNTDLGPGRIDQHDTSPVFGGTVAINADGDIAFAATLTPENDNQTEWGTGMFIAYADEPTAVTASAAASRMELRISPTPFRDGASVRFVLSERAAIRLELLDVGGRRVARLADGVRAAGPHRISIDGRTLTSGVYFVRLVSGDGAAVRRIVKVR
jgi:hypothetical protein